jgi:hypothetical protein
MPIGFDAGTYNLVCCQRNEEGEFVYKREVNAFLDIPLDNRFVFQMMKKAGVPLIERENVAYALGEAAVNMAYTMSQLELKRPMVAGCVNPKERDAFQILKIMMHSLLDDVQDDNDVLYYSVPANAINEETDAEYHGKILEAIFKGFKKDGKQVQPFEVNEALALVYAELSHKAYTGIGMSFGAGMVNVCFSMFGNPVFKFSLVNSGDWIDKMAAKATGESIAFINQEKHKIDLSKAPETLVERAIQTQYSIMVEKTVSGIKNGLASMSDTVHVDKPIDVVVAGGTAMPNGFHTLFKDVLAQANMPIGIGEVIKPKDPLYSVARGCLLVAEAAVNS